MKAEPKTQYVSKAPTSMNESQLQNNPSHAEIALLAYTISQSQKGRHRGSEENWLEAERILKEQRLAALGRSAADPKASKTKLPPSKK